MRMIDLLGMQTKIITTNSDLKNYDIYDPDHILIIDRNNPDFLNLTSIPIPDDIIYEYFYNWLQKILK